MLVKKIISCPTHLTVALILGKSVKTVKNGENGGN